MEHTKIKTPRYKTLAVRGGALAHLSSFGGDEILDGDEPEK